MLFGLSESYYLAEELNAVCCLWALFVLLPLNAAEAGRLAETCTFTGISLKCNKTLRQDEKRGDWHV